MGFYKAFRDSIDASRNVHNDYGSGSTEFLILLLLLEVFDCLILLQTNAAKSQNINISLKMSISGGKSFGKLR